jgi:hypothetical protein
LIVFSLTIQPQSKAPAQGGIDGFFQFSPSFTEGFQLGRTKMNGRQF